MTNTHNGSDTIGDMSGCCIEILYLCQVYICVRMWILNLLGCQTSSATDATCVSSIMDRLRMSSC